MITIKVTVSGAVVQVPFHTIIDSKNQPDYMFVIKDKPFELNVDLHNGKHAIYVNGKNAENAKTTISVLQDGVLLDEKVYDKKGSIFYIKNITI